MRRSVICAVLLCLAFSGGETLAQTSSEPTSTEASCTFADGKQMSARYKGTAFRSKQKLPMGKVWTPGDSPMDLFTQADVSVGGSEIPVGAYSMYVIPDKKTWTLILNKNVTAGSPYDEKQDLLRVPMKVGHLSTPVDFKVVFGHVAAQQCNMRIYYGKTGTWAEFKEK